jgi:Transglutaminase-like superfamily
VKQPDSARARRLQSIRWHLRTRADVWLATRMLAWRLVLPALKRIVSIDTLARAMRRGRGPRPAEEDSVVRLASWIYGSRPLTGGQNCLERSLVLYRYLSQTNPDTRLVVGFRNGERLVEGHAWVAVGERSMGADTDEQGPYAPLISFGPEGRILEGTRDGA